MNCFVGEVTHEQCHKQDYKPVPEEVISLSDLPEEDQNLLKLRVSAEIKISVITINLNIWKNSTIYLERSVVIP